MVVFDGIMNAEFYCLEIIERTLKLFTEYFPEGYRFMQDNDPKHTSKLAQKTFTELNINWWKTPPKSPDLNPIENLMNSKSTCETM